MRRWGVVVAVLAGAAGCGTTNRATELPDVEVVRLSDGTSIALNAIELPAVINVWATTCSPCVTEMPVLQAAAADVADVDIVGLNNVETRDAVQTFIDQLGVDYDQLLDERGFAAEALDVTSLPFTVAVDSDGQIVETVRGEMDEAELDRLIAAARG